MSSDDGSDMGCDDDILNNNVNFDELTDNILRNKLKDNTANNVDDNDEEFLNQLP